jgi:hypothetical protein
LWSNYVRKQTKHWKNRTQFGWISDEIRMNFVPERCPIFIIKILLILCKIGCFSDRFRAQFFRTQIGLKSYVRNVYDRMRFGYDFLFEFRVKIVQTFYIRNLSESQPNLVKKYDFFRMIIRRNSDKIIRTWIGYKSCARNMTDRVRFGYD